MKYPIRDRYRCVSKRPSKYTQIHAKYRSQKKPSIGQVSVWQYLCPGIGPAIPVSQVSVWRYLCPDRYMTIRCDTSKYTPIRGDTRQYDAILQNTHRYVAIHDNTMRYFKIHTDTRRYTTIHANTGESVIQIQQPPTHITQSPRPAW